MGVNVIIIESTCCVDPAMSAVPWKIPNILFTTLGFSKSVELQIIKLPMISTSFVFTVEPQLTQTPPISRHLVPLHNYKFSIVQQVGYNIRQYSD